MMGLVSTTTRPTNDPWHGLEAEAAEYVRESILAGDRSVVAVDFLAWAGLDIVDEFGRSNILAALNKAAALTSVACTHCTGHGERAVSYDGDVYRAPCGDCADRGGFVIEGPVVWSHEELEAAVATGSDDDLNVAAE